MRKRSVPYTIKRNGIYYLNLGWNNQFIRQSLATKDPMEAFQKVNQIAPIFANTHACEQVTGTDIFYASMHIHALKLIIERNYND
jgi:hypothetical protein